MVGQRRASGVGCPWQVRRGPGVSGAERDELYAIRLALRLRPGGGTVVIDGREVTVIDPILGAP